MPRVPKLVVPFRITPATRTIEGIRVQGTQSAAVTEQDSEQEISQCVEALLRTPLGSRVEEPEYGLPQLEFEEGWVDNDKVRSAIEEWEPRADRIVTEDLISDAERSIRISSNQEETMNG